MRPSVDPALLDPAQCGEDLLHNAARVIELASRYCDGCADYHVRSATHRYAGPPKGMLDRPQLISLISQIISDKVGGPDETIEIVIPGCADTAVLSTCAHAAAMLGGEVLDRCHFTVLDRCLTPLKVCDEFAMRYGLRALIQQADLGSAAKPCDADLIVTHSIFRFIPHANQPLLLKRLGSWLAPQGRLILSNRILRSDAEAEAKAELRKRQTANKVVGDALAKGLLYTAASSDETLARLERALGDAEGRPGEFHSLAEVRSLIRQSGLVELSLQSLDWEIAAAPGESMRRKRALGVLARGDADG